MRPVGSDHEIQVDVRIIAATNRNLTEAVADGSFREDLFYRLETFALQVPPLRARGDDIQRLAEFFLTRFNARQQRQIKGFSDEALGVLQNYLFPGNVRELQNAVERAATFCDSPLIEVRHLPQRIYQQTGDHPAPQLDFSPALPCSGEADGMPSLETVQRNYIHQVLHATGGNKRRAAEILGITRRTLYRWLE